MTIPLTQLPPVSFPPLGYELYSGASRLDGSPIVVLATLNSKNRKTGNMVQTWILRSDMEPTVALTTGADESVCGGCTHRGNRREGGDRPRSCYVNVGHAPNGVWRAWQAGRYVPLERADWSRSALAGRPIRFGAYGDPGAAPLALWRGLRAIARTTTGYTHQWRRFPGLKGVCMASVDSLEEQEEARRRGWRTFRVRMPDAPLADQEIECPASDRSGKLTTCENCGLCMGTHPTAKDISIEAHGGIATMNGIKAMARNGKELV